MFGEKKSVVISLQKTTTTCPQISLVSIVLKSVKLTDTAITQYFPGQGRGHQTKDLVCTNCRRESYI